MSHRATQILQDALQLPPTERAAIVEGLVSSLDWPDERLDALWVKEAEARVAAYQAGRIVAVPAEDVFTELDRE